MMSSMKDDGDFPYLQNEKGLILQGYVARTASFISFRDRENSYHLSKPKNTIVGILDARLVLASRGCLAEGNCRLEAGNCLEDTSTNPCYCERFARQARVISHHYLESSRIRFSNRFCMVFYLPLSKPFQYIYIIISFT